MVVIPNFRAMKKLFLSFAFLASFGTSQLFASSCLNQFSSEMNTAQRAYNGSMIDATLDAVSGDPFSFLNTATQAYLDYQEAIHVALTHLCWCDKVWCLEQN